MTEPATPEPIADAAEPIADAAEHTGGSESEPEVEAPGPRGATGATGPGAPLAAAVDADEESPILPPSEKPEGS